MQGTSTKISVTMQETLFPVLCSEKTSAAKTTHTVPVQIVDGDTFFFF